MSNIREIPKPVISDFAKLVGKIREEQQSQIEYLRLKAQQHRELFKAYVANGFTEAQAMELLKAEIQRS